MALIFLLLILLSVYVGSSKMESDDKGRYFIVIGIIIGVLFLTALLRKG